MHVDNEPGDKPGNTTRLTITIATNEPVLLVVLVVLVIIVNPWNPCNPRSKATMPVPVQRQYSEIAGVHAGGRCCDDTAVNLSQSIVDMPVSMQAADAGVDAAVSICHNPSSICRRQCLCHNPSSKAGVDAATMSICHNPSSIC